MAENNKLIDPVSLDPMHVSWDLGRRCNLDCSYCPPHRHDNVSSFTNINELKKTSNFLFDYLDLIMDYRKSKWVSLGFTGGEPTANPSFIEFSKWFKEQHSKRKNDYSISVNVTTNGLFNKKIRDALVDYFDCITVSFHSEATKKQKNIVVNNIKFLKKSGKKINVNVMFHGKEDFFKEAKELCSELYKNEIEFIPRMIGEHGDNNKYHHKYSSDQMKWMSKYWDMKKKDNLKEFFKRASLLDKLFKKFEKKNNAQEIKLKKVENKKETARSLGRPCCGNREMFVVTENGQKEKTKFISNANFMNWYCSVNWFFLHIEQQEKLVYYHQTCQANFNGDRGAIAHLDNTDKFLNDIKVKIENEGLPIIQCPNKICGCGLCTPKAKNNHDFKEIITRHVNEEVFHYE